MNKSRNDSEENENESYDVAYIGILSFLWSVPCRCRLGFWLVGSFFGHTLFNFSDFDWEVYYRVGSTHSPGFGFTIAYWQSRLEIVYPVCFLS